MGEIKNRRGERSYFTRFFAFFPHCRAWPSRLSPPPPTPTPSSSSSSSLFFFLLLLFFGIIQSQAANCKLPKRSEIYNCRFKNTNIVSIYIIVVIIEFGSCCKFGFFFPALHHFTLHLISISVSSHWVISWFVQCVHVTCQIWFQVNFKLTQVDSQFPLSPSPNYSRIRARRQRKLGINLAVKKNLTWSQN